MHKILIWISIMRLRTLPLSISGIVLGSFFAYYNGFFQWRICLLAILTTLSFQILSNLANDYGDGVKGTDNTDRIGPERGIQSGKISKKDLFNGIVWNVVISILLSAYLIFTAFGLENLSLSIVFLFLGIISVIAAMLYTMGEKAYGYNGLGDLFVFIFFGLLSVIGSYVLYEKNLNSITYLPACVIGLLSVAVLNLNNMRDRLSDKKSNKITLVVRLGDKKAKVYHNLLVFSAMILSLCFGIVFYDSLINFMYVITFIPLLLHVKRINTNQNPALLDPELKKLAFTTFLLAVLMGFGGLL